MLTTTDPISLTEDRTRIVMRTRYSAAFVEFVHSLPDAKWDKRQKTWSCLATPAAAFRLKNAPAISQVWNGDAHHPVAVLANQFNVARLFSQNALAPDIAQSDPTSKTRSWRHQKVAFNFCTAPYMDAVLLEMGMGTGKSKVVVDLLHYLTQLACLGRHGEAEPAPRALIICPLSVCQVWRREFRKHSAGDPIVTILDKGSVAKKAAAANATISQGRNRNVPAVVVINYESARSPAFASWSLLQPWNLAVLDESQRAKAPNSQVSKYVARLGRVAGKRICLSGTPINTPLDVFGQLRFLDPGIFGDSWFQFRNRYAVYSNPCIPQQVTGHKNLDELQERYRWITYQVGTEVLDLPPVQHHTLTFEMSAAARRIYRGLETELIAEIKSGVVTAANALVKLLRLQQLTSGFCVEEETRREEIVDVGKYGLLVDLLTDIDPQECVVVFCKFRSDLAKAEMAAELTGRQYGELSGDRKDLVDGMIPEGITCLGVQIQAGGVGVDLSRAAYAIYFSLGFSLLEYEQSLARVHRPGQTKPVHYYRLIAEKSVDEYLYKVLEKRKDVVSQLLTFYTEGECDE